MESELDLYRDCTLCPNNCHADRNAGKTGRCLQTSTVRVAWSGLHRGEEPPITGEHGSGMIFFSGCPLHCQYCQNYQITCSKDIGVPVTEEELANLMLELQAFKAASINLVTGTHFIPSIIAAVRLAKENGLHIPIVWNSSGYETPRALKLIDSFVDLYLFDVKTLDRETASKFCGLSGYADAVVPAVTFLKRRHPETNLETDLKGTLIRHLVFPGELESTKRFLKWYADNLKDCTLLSLMVQFVPPLENPGFEKLSDAEYRELTDLLDKYEIDGFIQEQEENEILWIPDFNKDQPFPESFADPLPYFLSLKEKKTKKTLILME